VYPETSTGYKLTDSAAQSRLESRFFVDDGLWREAPLLTGQGQFEPLPDVKNILVTGGEGFMCVAVRPHPPKHHKLIRRDKCILARPPSRDKTPRKLQRRLLRQARLLQFPPERAHAGEPAELPLLPRRLYAGRGCVEVSTDSSDRYRLPSRRAEPCRSQFWEFIQLHDEQRAGDTCASGGD